MCHQFVYYITWSLVPGMEPLKCFPNWSPRVWSQPIEPFRSTLPIAYLVKNKQHYKNVTIQHHKNHLTFVSVSYSRDEKWDCCGWSTTDKYSSSNVKNWSKLQSIAVNCSQLQCTFPQWLLLIWHLLCCQWSFWKMLSCWLMRLFGLIRSQVHLIKGSSESAAAFITVVVSEHSHVC